jgi:hypothetical protein
VAPKDQPQSELFLRKLHDVLNDPASAKELEDATGVSRERVEQFAKKFPNMKSAPAGPGREINVKPGEQTPAQPSPDLPGLDKSTRFTNKNVRERGTMPQDETHEHSEGIRFQPPPEWRGKMEDFKNRLAKVATPKRAASATPPPKGGK